VIIFIAVGLVVAIMTDSEELPEDVLLEAIRLAMDEHKPRKKHIKIEENSENSVHAKVQVMESADYKDDYGIDHETDPQNVEWKDYRFEKDNLIETAKENGLINK